MSAHEGLERPKLTDEALNELKADMRGQFHNIIGVAIDRCQTPQELFDLKDLLIALNGLIGTVKEKNG